MQNIDQNEENIDLRRLMQIAFERKKVTGSIVVGCTAIAILVAFALPKQYESTTVVQTRGTTAVMSGAAAAMAALSGGSANDTTTNYIELMKTRAVLDPIIDDMPWWKEKDDGSLDKMDNVQFAKKYLTIENTKKTNLITVKARAYTPEEAQYISQSVVDNFLALQTGMNNETQSLLLQFLNERIETARQEAEEARQKFAEFQKEHKVYSPTDQAKSIVAQTEGWNKAIGDMEVQQQAAQAQLAAVQAQIGDQESRSDAYQINDNENVQKLRSSIVGKQVELVGLRQKYTDNHPSVIAAQRELEQLEQSLKNEVDAIVGSHTATMNPMHAKLVEQQVEGEVGIETAKASKAALEKRKAEKEKELGDFPQDAMDYVNLKGEAEMKQGIYTNLVQQSETARIKQAMDSMDVQVVDPANLPLEDKPAAPRKKLIAAVGMLIGLFISAIYSLVIYKREEA